MNAKLNEHTQIADLLPLYVSGALDRDQRAAVERHLSGCAECQEDLQVWKAVSGEVVTADQAVSAPVGLAARAIAQVEQSRPANTRANTRAIALQLRRIVQLLRSQMPLVHREIWPSSALVIGLGYIAALISAQSVFIYALAPLVAAGCVSLIYGPENDPAFELALSTPTSPRQILLARLALVFGYNLGLVLFATLGLQPVVGNQPLLGSLALAWLAPMTFLSAAALALSLWIGASNAVSVTYLVWLGNLLVGPLRSPQAGLNLSPLVVQAMNAYQHFWQASGLLLILSVGLLIAAAWLAGRNDRELLNPA